MGPSGDITPHLSKQTVRPRRRAQDIVSQASKVNTPPARFAGLQPAHRSEPSTTAIPSEPTSVGRAATTASRPKRQLRRSRRAAALHARPPRDLAPILRSARDVSTSIAVGAPLDAKPSEGGESLRGIPRLRDPGGAALELRLPPRLESWNRYDDPAQVALREFVAHVHELIDPRIAATASDLRSVWMLGCPTRSIRRGSETSTTTSSRSHAHCHRVWYRSGEPRPVVQLRMFESSGRPDAGTG